MRLKRQRKSSHRRYGDAAAAGTASGLAAYTGGAMREAVRSIVGVQFRNLATVGGSIWGRFGFSDVLTLFLALDTRVLLYRAGEMSLWEFAGMKKDNDILTGLTVRKRPQKTAYLAYRNTKTDFPVLTCAMALAAGKDVGDFQGMAAVGARPGRAICLELPESCRKTLSGALREKRRCRS